MVNKLKRKIEKLTEKQVTIFILLYCGVTTSIFLIAPASKIADIAAFMDIIMVIVLCNYLSKQLYILAWGHELKGLSEEVFVEVFFMPQHLNKIASEQIKDIIEDSQVKYFAKLEEKKIAIVIKNREDEQVGSTWHVEKDYFIQNYEVSRD